MRTKSVVTWNHLAQPFEIWKMHTVAIVEHNKKRMKENEQKLIPEFILQPIYNKT